MADLKELGDEPSYVATRTWAVAAFADHLRSVAGTVSRPLVIAVDGRSAGGKTTLAARLGAIAGWACVHTDDIAWWHSYFDWVDLMVDGVLGPARRGDAVAYRPPAWDERDRDGAVVVPAGIEVLVVEGVGSSQPRLAEHLDARIWVHTPWSEIDRREQHRIATGEVSAQLQHDWMTAELVFHAEHRPWHRVDVVVDGTCRDIVELRPVGSTGAGGERMLGGCPPPNA